MHCSSQSNPHALHPEQCVVSSPSPPCEGLENSVQIERFTRANIWSYLECCFLWNWIWTNRLCNSIRPNTLWTSFIKLHLTIYIQEMCWNVEHVNVVQEIWCDIRQSRLNFCIIIHKHSLAQFVALIFMKNLHRNWFGFIISWHTMSVIYVS